MIVTNIFMSNDFFLIFYWWSLLFFIGAIFLPTTWILFNRFFDFGYNFSKILGLLLITYFVWLLSSLKILAFSSGTILFVLGASLLINLFVFKKYQQKILQQIKKSPKIILLEEFLFFLALAFWAYVRGFQPDIEGLEKFMDFGFVNSILRSQFFPPADMWMAGKSINYYYFGHLVAALLTKLSGIDSAVTYNLMLATIFAFTFTASLSLSANFFYLFKPNARKMILIGSLLSGLLVTFGGNLQILWWFLGHRFSFSGYWYPDATRFIVEKFGAADNTIHEFPIYSFVVSDLHGHVSDIPFVFLSLSIIFAWLLDAKESFFKLRYLPFLALTFAVMYMTNSWDFPIYFLFFGLTAFLFNLIYPKKFSFSEALWKTGSLSVIIFVASLLFSLPFHLNFSQIAKGLDLVRARSPLWQLSFLWGYQWVLALSFIAFLVLHQKIIKVLVQAKRITKISKIDLFVFIALLVATLLIVLPEIIYVKDIYIASYHRANTMFKFVYQSFILYALAAGYIVVRLATALQNRTFKIPLFTFYFLLLTFVLIYPYFAIKSYYGNLKTYKGLYGLGFLEQSSPDDFAGVLWLKNNISGQPHILEAVGDSYTSFNRVSMATGLPTVEGWLVHEWLWRGSFDEPGKRSSEVETIYTTKDAQTAENLLRKYQVNYVFVGDKEREKYKVEEEKFKKLGSVAFAQGNTTIYSLEKPNSQ